MLEDRILLWKFKQGSSEALEAIYDKYGSYLLTVATALVNDVHTAEDVVHDFFLAFAGSADTVRLDGNFKAYLATCVANRARNRLKRRRQLPPEPSDGGTCRCRTRLPDELAMSSETNVLVHRALGQLPYEQREVVILHLHGGLAFTRIARFRNTSANTIRSRYRYAIEKLRSLLNDEVTL